MAEKAGKGLVQKIGKALVGVGLPVLGNAVGGPAGGSLAKAVVTAIGIDSKDDESAIERKLAEASPEVLVRLREMDTQMALAELENARSEASEITARHRTDMESDVPMAKYVRPAGLMFVLVSYVAYQYLITFALPKEDMTAALNVGQQLLTLAEGFVYFYVGSRGLEKGIQMYRGNSAAK